MEENGVERNRMEYDIFYFDFIKCDIFLSSLQTDSIYLILLPTSMIPVPFNRLRKPMQQVVSELASEQRPCPKGQVTMSRAQRFYERQHAWLQAFASWDRAEATIVPSRHERQLSEIVFVC